MSDNVSSKVVLFIKNNIVRITLIISLIVIIYILINNKEKFEGDSTLDQSNPPPSDQSNPPQKDQSNLPQTDQSNPPQTYSSLYQQHTPRPLSSFIKPEYVPTTTVPVFLRPLLSNGMRLDKEYRIEISRLLRAIGKQINNSNMLCELRQLNNVFDNNNIRDLTSQDKADIMRGIMEVCQKL